MKPKHPKPCQCHDGTKDKSNDHPNNPFPIRMLGGLIPLFVRTHKFLDLSEDLVGEGEDEHTVHDDDRVCHVVQIGYNDQREQAQPHTLQKR